MPCVPIRNESSAAEKPFLARTLYAARQAGDDGSCSWWKRMTGGTQHRGSAQASARYLKLLQDGAREHGLPGCYQEYLGSLQPYTMMHRWQKVGEWVFLCMWAPLLLFLLKTTGLLADETGRLPPQLAAGMNMLFNLMWLSYDVAFKPIFGDGERTEADGRGESNPGQRLCNGKDR